MRCLRKDPSGLIGALAIITFFCLGNLLRAETEVQGGSIGTTTWTGAGSPYIVLESLTVSPGETLTIEPGVVIRFERGVLLAVDGHLIAEGTESEKILFTSNSEDPKIRDWSGMTFRSAGNRLRWCVIEYARIATYIPWGDLSITDSTVRLCERGIAASALAIACTGYTATATVQRCLIEKNTYFGVYFGGNGDKNTGCTIPKTGAVSGKLRNSTIRSNGVGISSGSGYMANSGVEISSSHGYMTHGFADCQVEGNLIYENGGSGVGLSGNGANMAVVRNNQIHDNGGAGIRSWASVGQKEVVENTITGNQQNGIENGDGRISFQDNEITGNSPYGIFTTHARSITGNEIHGNGQYDLYYTDSLDQLTAFNDWGTTDRSIIDSRIYDKEDDSALGKVIYDWGKELYFAQFGDGESQLTSEILLLNVDRRGEAQIDIYLRGDDGQPLAVDLNGVEIPGHLRTTVPPGGMRSFRTDGEGSLKVGSVTVTSDRTLSGVIKFGGAVGLAGVGSSLPADHGLLAPMEARPAAKINTGIAIMNLENADAELEFELCDPSGTLLARSEGLLPGLGHLAKFLGEFEWDNVPDLSDFRGLLKIRSQARLAATVLQTRSNEFATMPVASLSEPGSSSQQVGFRSLAVPAADSAFAYRLQFAQFGEGQGQLFSQFLLFNLSEEMEAGANLELRDDNGEILTVDLNGTETTGTYSFTIPASGMEVLETDGLGPLVVGSATLASNQPVAGVVVFGGSFGVAGVGDSRSVYNGFVAPVEIDLQNSINSGIALMNPNDFWITSLLEFELLDVEGNHVAGAAMQLPQKGHRAIHVNEIDWDTLGLDFSRFQGLLKVSCPVPIAATIIRTSRGQFATMPVVPVP